ncbi:hypothetical protein RYX36_007657 [Vicia faba]
MADPTSFIATWFTPFSIFIFVNLVIGTIALTSRFNAPPKNQTNNIINNNLNLNLTVHLPFFNVSGPSISVTTITTTITSQNSSPSPLSLNSFDSRLYYSESFPFISINNHIYSASCFSDQTGYTNSSPPI